MVTQTTIFVSLYSCKKKVTLKTVGRRAKHVGENIVNKIHHNVVGLIYSYDTEV
jgi:hypothetical protein